MTLYKLKAVGLTLITIMVMIPHEPGVPAVKMLKVVFNTICSLKSKAFCAGALFN